MRSGRASYGSRLGGMYFVHRHGIRPCSFGCEEEEVNISGEEELASLVQEK